MRKPAELELDFNGAAEALPRTGFVNSLLQEENVDPGTALKVIKAFEQMGLPAPEETKEAAHSEHGGKIIFINDCGLVIRIEEGYWERINGSPWIIQPIASIKIGELIMEIIPAANYEADESNSHALRELLLQEGFHFWDYGARNVGRIPVNTPRFPDGIPVVIDRPGVNRLPADDERVLQARLRMTKEDIEKYKEAVQAQNKLYAPLRQLFSECWPDPKKMECFLDECRRYVREGKFIAGWNDAASSDVHDEKASYAYNVAKNYETRLQLAQRPVSSAAPAVLRSPLRSI